ILVQLIVFLAPENQDTAAGLARATLILVVPFSIVGPFAGVLIDRWSRRRILTITPLVRAAAALALLPLAGESPLLYAFALVVTSLNRFFLATASASLPSVVREEELLVANSMAAVGGTTVTFAGFGIGTQLADTVGTGTLLVAMAVLYGMASVLSSRIRTPLRPRRSDEHPLADVSVDLKDVVAGVRRLRATPPALASIVSLSLDQALIGLVTAMSLVVFRDEFNQGVASYGRIVGAGGVGILVGILTVGSLEARLSKPRIVAFGFLLAGVVTLTVSPFVSGPSLLLMSFVLGLTFAYRKIPADTIVQESVPDRFRGRVFSAYDLLYGMARPLGVALAIPLIPNLSTGALIALIGAAYLLWTPVLPRWVRRPVSVGVRFYAGGKADEVPRALVVAGEEEPVELVRSVLEEAGGQRRRRLELRAQDGNRIDVWSREGSETWFVSRW
ncbi:MAG: MFS transporter, partial [Actinobacteria bacterium]|nr:MFS transporter [Actinomycetota bacterium]